jgi:hypothetical protein
MPRPKTLSDAPSIIRHRQQQTRNPTTPGDLPLAAVNLGCD